MDQGQLIKIHWKDENRPQILTKDILGKDLKGGLLRAIDPEAEFFYSSHKIRILQVFPFLFKNKTNLKKGRGFKDTYDNLKPDYLTNVPALLFSRVFQKEEINSTVTF